MTDRQREKLVMNGLPGRIRGRHRRLWPLVLAIPVLLLVVAWADRRSILRESAALWVVSDQLQPADAIAVLGGGVTLRPFIAARLYKKGLAPKILVANARPDAIVRLGVLPSTADLTRQILLKLGIPEKAIIDFGTNVASTFDEARALADWAKHSGARTIIVPTEIFSTRRQGWILDRELASVGARVIIDAITPPDYNVDDWWRHTEGLIDFESEVAKYAYYRWKY